MKIETFVISWNEERLIEHYIDWYSKVADKITILDNHSSDRTAEIAKFKGCEVIPWGGPEQNNYDMLRIKNECWKKSKADWVIVGDMDEFLFMPNFNTVLANTNATIVKPAGYTMVSENFIPPKEARYGYRDTGYDKTILFKPEAIKEMNWQPGCHISNPEGKVIFNDSDPQWKLLHFHLLGRLAVHRRYAEYSGRMSQSDKDHRHGWQYLSTTDEINKGFDNALHHAVIVW
jgi:hypothetical protein